MHTISNIFPLSLSLVPGKPEKKKKEEEEEGEGEEVITELPVSATNDRVMIGRQWLRGCRRWCFCGSFAIIPVVKFCKNKYIKKKIFNPILCVCLLNI